MLRQTVLREEHSIALVGTDQSLKRMMRGDLPTWRTVNNETMVQIHSHLAIETLRVSDIAQTGGTGYRS